MEPECKRDIMQEKLHKPNYMLMSLQRICLLICISVVVTIVVYYTPMPGQYCKVLLDQLSAVFNMDESLNVNIVTS